MILFDKNTITKKVIGTVSEHDCINCQKLSYWELCIVRVWISVLTIPLLPYCQKYCLVCNNCDYYIELEKAEFDKIEKQILSGSPRTEPDALKYLNKNPIQLNYIKTLENYR